ncbi:MAG: TonB-dependent receptor plug domain-containing protein [Bacteroidales bacterium]|nr:TonB-dependent receptor plug domain-containing protein [Bacteroidales bacterium]
MKIKLLILIVISFTLFSDLPAQKSGKRITISGKAVDLYLYPVAGAVVMIDGIDTGIKTDDGGKFKIKTDLSASNIGIFTTSAGLLEEPINGRKRINFYLEKYVAPAINAEDNIRGDVIDDGYSVTRKNDMSMPVTITDVSGREFASYTSIYEVLRMVPGVSVVSGESGTDVFLRNQTPLFVVNGSVINSLSIINPSMVKSIVVLKGPSASVYGLNGANGVIVFEMK